MEIREAVRSILENDAHYSSRVSHEEMEETAEAVAFLTTAADMGFDEAFSKAHFVDNTCLVLLSNDDYTIDDCMLENIHKACELVNDSEKWAIAVDVFESRESGDIVIRFERG